MIPSDACFNIIRKWEGCSLKSYKCPAGVWTIGYGHTDGVKEGDTITMDEAKHLLETDVLVYADCVNKAVKYPLLTQSMFDALVSFTYNNGCGSLQSSTLLKKLNTAQVAAAANEFDRWVNAKDPKTGQMRPLPGLVKRRAEEKSLFLIDDEEPAITFADHPESAPVCPTCGKPK